MAFDVGWKAIKVANAEPSLLSAYLREDSCADGSVNLLWRQQVGLPAVLNRSEYVLNQQEQAFHDRQSKTLPNRLQWLRDRSRDIL